MEIGRKAVGATVLVILATSLALPLTVQASSAQTLNKPEILPYGPTGRGNWTWIKTDTINILFPAGGKKPMFLWWFAEDTSNIYVLKYKGLIEFMTFGVPYYQRVHENSSHLRYIPEGQVACPKRQAVRSQPDDGYLPPRAEDVVPSVLS